MVPALITFIAVLAAGLGACWLVLVRPEQQARQALKKRMKPEDPARKKRLAMSDAELRGRATPFKSLQATVDQSGLKLTVAGLMFACTMSGFVIGLIAWTLSARVIVAALAAAVGAWLPYFAVRQVAARRMWKFEEQFPEAIELIARALRAGHAFPTGLSMVADELGPPVGPEFKLLYDRQNYGMALPDALRGFAQRVPVLDARFFVTAVLTQREAGGNLSGVLDNLASVIRERFKVKRQVRVISAHGRMTAAILSGLPPLVGIAQGFIAPDNARMLLNDDLGVKMLIGAAALQIFGMFVISRIIKVDY